jgi:uncharacterized damage-inducible protein DinB
MPSPRDLQLLARYNRWMNGKLYAAVAEWDDEALQRDRGAFFGSVFATLGHLVEADLIWLMRFAEHSEDFTALEPLSALTHPYLLSGPRYGDFAALRDARERLDETILAFAGEITAGHVEQRLRYHNRAGEVFDRPLGPLLLHFFNHQTHHRGQVTTLLSQAGIDVGDTDLCVLVE